MADFKIDTSTFTAVKQSYDSASKDMNQIVTDLNRQISDLQNINWKSDASKLFFSKYKDKWAINVKKYTSVIDCMANLLSQAQSSYENLATEAEKLKY